MVFGILIAVPAIMIPLGMLLFAQTLEGLAHPWRGAVHDPATDPSCLLAIAGYSIPMIVVAVALVMNARLPPQNM